MSKPSSNLKRNIRILIEEHLQLTDANSQVAVCELIRDVKTKRSKLSPLNADPVEETQRQQQVFKYRILKQRNILS